MALGVAIIDSGATTPHPHLPGVAGGIWIRPDGSEHEEISDRIGHGTAVAAAIRERAPEAEIWIVKIFDRELSTTVSILQRAIDWAVGRRPKLINLSLGVTDKAMVPRLLPAVERAQNAGCLLVSAAEYEGAPVYPGSFPGVVGVVVDWQLPRDRISVRQREGGKAVFAASGLPRPVPGIPPRANLYGTSFAVANVTGIMASSMLQGYDPLRGSGHRLN